METPKDFFYSLDEAFSFIVQWCFVHKYITPALSKDNTTYIMVDEFQV